MGREIRRVTPDWVHPVYTSENACMLDRIGKCIPMFDQDYKAAADGWIASLKDWLEGKHPMYAENRESKS